MHRSSPDEPLDDGPASLRRNQPRVRGDRGGRLLNDDQALPPDDLGLPPDAQGHGGSAHGHRVPQVDISVRNISQGEAKDITFEFSAPVENSDGTVISDLVSFKEGLDFLAVDGDVSC